MTYTSWRTYGNLLRPHLCRHCEDLTFPELVEWPGRDIRAVCSECGGDMEYVMPSSDLPWHEWDRLMDTGHHERIDSQDWPKDCEFIDGDGHAIRPIGFYITLT